MCVFIYRIPQYVTLPGLWVKAVRISGPLCERTHSSYMLCVLSLGCVLSLSIQLSDFIRKEKQNVLFSRSELSLQCSLCEGTSKLGGLFIMHVTLQAYAGVRGHVKKSAMW